jgi:uncharacterized protein YndB with AHSA1/START domain
MPSAKIVLTAFLLTLLLAVLGLLLAAWLLPGSRSFSNEVEIAAPADAVWDVITDKGRYTEWQTAIEKVEVIDEQRWIEYPSGAPESLHFEVAEDERPRRMVFSYKMGDSFSGRWEGEIEEVLSGIRLKTLDSYKVEGSFTKIMLAAFFDMDGFAKDWNAKLKRRVESLQKEQED